MGAPVQAMSCQLSQENAIGDSIKGFTEDQVDNIHIHWEGHLVIKGNQVGQAGPAPPKPLLAGPDPLVVLCVLCAHIQDDLFHNLARC